MTPVQLFTRRTAPVQYVCGVNWSATCGGTTKKFVVHSDRPNQLPVACIASESVTSSLHRFAVTKMLRVYLHNIYVYLQQSNLLV